MLPGACALAQGVCEQNTDTARAEIPCGLRSRMQRSNAVYSLHEAAMRGDVGVARARLAEGADIEKLDELGRTPLFVAVQAKQQAVIDILLDHGADLLACDATGRCILDFYKGQDLSPAGKKAFAMLAHRKNTVDAIERGDLELLKKCLATGLSPNSRHEAKYLLQYAIDKEDTRAVELLLNVGASPNIRYTDGKSALHIVAGRGLTDIAQLLVAKGADPLAKTRNGATPLHEAVWYGKADVLRVLLPLYKADNFTPPGGGSGGFPVVLAISRGRTEVLRQFLAHGLQVNDPRFAQTPLLTCAVLGKNKEIVRLLLEAGADKTARDKDGKQAIDYADESMKALLQQ